MRRGPALFLSLLTIGAAACGGNVVVDLQKGSAAGGAATTTASGTTSSGSTSGGGAMVIVTATTTTTNATSTVGVTSSATATSATSASGVACPSPTNCATCADNASCQACNFALYPGAVPLYKPLEQCHRCIPCSLPCTGTVDCQGNGGDPGACGGFPPGPGACNACLTCADKGTWCKSTLIPCEQDPECAALLVALAACPGM
jgi:hypothetical protein